MMQKNERTLLVPWVRYHAERFGIENLYVFDNGSDDEATLDSLKLLENEGLQVSRGHPSKSDFENKGSIIAEKINELDDRRIYDFYFPVDCDEFLSVRKENKISIDAGDIRQELEKYVGEKRVLYIGSALFNNPVIVDEYMVVGKPEKSFFAKDTCESLDTGFHHGKSSKASGRVETSIAYFHFHNKPYDDYIFHAKQKMRGRLENFGRGDAAIYVAKRGAGAHLVSRMLKTREQYNEQFANRRNDPFPVQETIMAPELRMHLEAIGAPLKWRAMPPDSPSNPTPSSTDHADLFGWWVDRGPNWGLMKGHVDAISDVDGRLTFSGWACDRDGRPAPQLIVMADSEIVPIREFSSVLRPDVSNALPGASASCGFHIVVATTDIPADTLELRLVSHDPRDRSTCIVKGRFGHAVRWSDVMSQAGRSPSPAKKPDGQPKPEARQSPKPSHNQWKLPAETDHGARPLLRQWDDAAPVLAAGRWTGLDRRDYLAPIRDGVRFFSQFQDDNGAIVDPYRGEEFQYSTPCFAFAAALAGLEGEGDLVDCAARAMDWACLTLSQRRAATAHEDFFASPIAHALPLLAGKVPAETLSRWRGLLAGFDPFATYRHKVGGTGDPGSNWNCKALAGEYLLHKAGVRTSIRYVEESLLAQGRLFSNEFGMYAEGPMVYDAFPRAWLGDMVAAGYDGAGAAELKEALDRGAAASLLLQAPNGELPCGGRSAHHIWADALQCVIFELAAADAAKAGDVKRAGMFKRGARLALRAIGHWRRPTGEFWIVKNRSHPALQHGYEGYSSHSQYNLLALTALGYAYQHAGATDGVAEQMTPAEGGHYVLELPAPFSKVVASNGGTQVIVARDRESTQTPAGLLRVFFGDGVPQLGPSDGLLAETGYALPGARRTNISVGLAWRAGSGWRGLADLKGIATKVAGIAAAARETAFTGVYDLPGEPVSGVTESYLLGPDRVEIGYEFAGSADGVAVRLPVLVSDGRNENAVSVGADSVSVSNGASTVTYTVAGAQASLSKELYGHRNGFVRIAEFFPTSRAGLRLRIDHRRAG